MVVVVVVVVAVFIKGDLLIFQNLFKLFSKTLGHQVVYGANEQATIGVARLLVEKVPWRGCASVSAETGCRLEQMAVWTF